MSKVQENGFLKAETTNLRSIFLHLNRGTTISPNGISFETVPRADAKLIVENQMRSP
ncbi:hypothetical protein APA_2246 [Pseudanabaena sp. lw0831]|uniref:hypothetical protein n=1 Tax=Pseudanabaena sp. lw0831 TaxID=1357935 RepID=UPI001915CC0C|nr:hypothetical protein [Pseudanabaena sp. lw0831]GBO54298.1 hypothetical protein APA_2246 [Pseudanabaena sp. lw0831]